VCGGAQGRLRKPSQRVRPRAPRAQLRARRKVLGNRSSRAALCSGSAWRVRSESSTSPESLVPVAEVAGLAKTAERCASLRANGPVVAGLPCGFDPLLSFDVSSAGSAGKGRGASNASGAVDLSARLQWTVSQGSADQGRQVRRRCGELRCDPAAPCTGLGGRNYRGQWRAEVPSGGDVGRGDLPAFRVSLHAEQCERRRLRVRA
jgi:hypothetical protein